MTLSGMIQLNEDAMICDFAETYHIYDYRTLPCAFAAKLAAGLREESRIKRLAEGRPASAESILLANLIDAVHGIMFGVGILNQCPESVVNKLYGEDGQDGVSGKYQTFECVEEFISTRNMIMEELRCQI